MLAACSAPAPAAQAPTTAAQQAPAAAGATAPAGATAKPAAPSSSGGGDSKTVQSASMPGSPAAYDPAKPPKVGEAVRLPSGMVVQVNGARTQNRDATTEWVLTDVTIGNTGKESQTVSSVLSFNVVSADWGWYGFGLEDVLQMATGSLPAPFDATLDPGQAKRGTALAIVPKDAKGLALAFTSQGALMGSMAAVAGQTADPTLFAPLGVRGDWTPPAVKDPAPLAAGKVYKAGDAVQLTKAAWAMQVNGARVRTEAVPNAQLPAGQQFVLVDLTARTLPGAAATLQPRSDLRLVDNAGGSYEYLGNLDALVAVATFTRGLAVEKDGIPARGIVTFSVPKTATGLALQVKPNGSPDELMIVDLGLGGAVKAPAAGAASSGAAAPSAAQQTAPAASKPAAPAASEPTVAPVAPQLADASTLPAELKDLPVPAGFGVVNGSTTRVASGGQFSVASATWFGKASVKDVGAFYKQALAATWNEDYYSDSTDALSAAYTNKKDTTLELALEVEKTESGTQVTLVLASNKNQ